MYQQSNAQLHEHFCSRVDRVGREGRHRSTGYEFVNDKRLAHYRDTLESEVKQQDELPARYMNGSNNLFEQIAAYDAVFNRILIYPCTSLHSGNIPEDFTFNTDPRSGRLSINTFIFCRN